MAGFIPDCIVLVRRLLSDTRVPRRRKLLLGLLIAYLALPFDLVPGLDPVAGQFDDAILVALVLRAILRAGAEELLREHWPGPEQSRLLVQRLAYGRRTYPGELPLCGAARLRSASRQGTGVADMSSTNAAGEAARGEPWRRRC